VFGSNIHPDLLKKQALQGCKESYEKSSISLNAESGVMRQGKQPTKVNLAPS
jgi:hypothetical protein